MIDLDSITKTLLQLRGLKLAERRRIVLTLPNLTGRQIDALPSDARDLYTRSLPPELRKRAWRKWSNARRDIEWENMPQAERDEIEEWLRSMLQSAPENNSDAGSHSGGREW